MVLDLPCFRASTRPQHVGPNNKNKHPGVELVPQCEDLNEEHVELPRHTVRGNPIPHSLFFSPFSFSLPPFLPFFLTRSLSLHSLHFLPSLVFILQHCFQVICSCICLCHKLLIFVQNSKHFLSAAHRNCLFRLFFFLLYQNKWSTVSRKNIPALFLPDIHPCSALTLSNLFYTYCWVMQCNTLIRKRGKKEVFLRPSSLTGSLRVSFMC